MESKFTCLAFFFLIFALTINQSNAELKQAFHVIRHGARTPSSFEFKSHQYPEMAGELTILGRVQHYHLGRELRKRYVDNLKFLSEVFDPSEVLVKASGKARVVASAYSFINGLYPQSDGTIHKNMYKASSLLKNFLPLQTRYHKPTEIDIMNISLNEIWAKAVVNVISSEKDMFFHADQGNNCPTVKKRLDEIKQSAEIQQFEAYFQKEVYPQVVNIINTALGFDRLSAQNLTIQAAKRVLDNYRCNSFHKVEHPEFNQDILDLLETVRYTFIYQILYKDTFVKAIAASKLLEDMNNYITAGQNGESFPKSIFYIAHDHNIEALFSLLVDEKKLIERKFFMVEFASLLSLEVHVEHQKVYIKLFYNDEPLDVKFCQGNVCTLDDFQAFVRKTLVPNLEDICAH